jgi:hypothetical protein
VVAVAGCLAAVSVRRGKCQSSSSAASGHAAAERRRTVNRAPRGGVMARPLSLAKAAGRQAIHSRTARHIVDTIIMKLKGVVRVEGGPFQAAS